MPVVLTGESQYNVPTSCSHIMKTVNVRQLKNNPSDALRMARKAPVVVMNRDQPEAVIVHLSEEGLLGEPGVRLAIATDLYRSESVSLGRGAKIAGIALAEFMQHVSLHGIPVIRSNVKTVREDVKKLAAWLKKGSKKGLSSATRAR
jgi:predicted HTH domain antitoxin